jgi:predicted 3-demethylubiquinone-9 3-methyltransferase (glyoxalase superfamily)
MTTVTPFLMFEGHAEEAMNFYVSLFRDAKIEMLERHAEGGKVKRAKISLAGQTIMMSDSPIKHAFTFTPSSSLFVECADEPEIDRLFAALSENGQVLMPLGSYGFSRKFGWINDRFGVSWQVNLA